MAEQRGEATPIDLHELGLLPHHQAFLERFIAACQADRRVLAAFLGGSYAKGTADARSDLDLTLITADQDYEDFVAGRAEFMRQLGDLVFLEDFDLQKLVFFIYSNDTEGELWFGSRSHLEHIRSGSYLVLLDKQQILAAAVFPADEPAEAEQTEVLRRQICWFWHDLSHFITALGRGQLWWAHSQLEALRLYCINLARLRQNFFDADVGSDGCFKVERALPGEQLAPLQPTYCPLERGAMLQAALLIVRFYQDLALTLAQRHGLAYPEALERVMIDRLGQLYDTPLS